MQEDPNPSGGFHEKLDDVAGARRFGRIPGQCRRNVGDGARRRPFRRLYERRFRVARPGARGRRWRCRDDGGCCFVGIGRQANPRCAGRTRQGSGQRGWQVPPGGCGRQASQCLFPYRERGRSRGPALGAGQRTPIHPGAGRVATASVLKQPFCREGRLLQRCRVQRVAAVGQVHGCGRRVPGVEDARGRGVERGGRTALGPHDPGAKRGDEAGDGGDVQGRPHPPGPAGAADRDRVGVAFRSVDA